MLQNYWWDFGFLHFYGTYSRAGRAAIQRRHWFANDASLLVAGIPIVQVRLWRYREFENSGRRKQSIRNTVSKSNLNFS